MNKTAIVLPALAFLFCQSCNSKSKLNREERIRQEITKNRQTLEDLADKLFNCVDWSFRTDTYIFPDDPQANRQHRINNHGYNVKGFLYTNSISPINAKYYPCLDSALSIASENDISILHTNRPDSVIRFELNTRLEYSVFVFDSGTQKIKLPEATNSYYEKVTDRTYIKIKRQD